MDEEIEFTEFQPIQGPPEVVHAVDLHRAYWIYNAEEQAQMEMRGLGKLNWREKLRLHHLRCLARLGPRADRTKGTEKCRESAIQLIASGSPYRPVAAMIWQGRADEPRTEREPDIQGELLNPSLTHFGCLEIYRLDATNRPTAVDFVGFDELTGVLFGPPSLIRIAKLFYEDGRSEHVRVPVLYGLTWAIGTPPDRRGEMTRFVAHLDGGEARLPGASGLGVGQQDLSVNKRSGGTSIFGIASVTEIAFPLDLQDPRFDEKARARGIDPDEVRRQMDKSSKH